MGLALLFPGQGTQHAQMLPWLEQSPAARPLLDELATLVGPDWRERLADAQWARSNAVAQPLLVGVELAAWSVLAPLLPPASVVAGYSVGELAAFAAAGVFEPRTALSLAVLRAQAMDRSVLGLATGLLAVRDLPMAAIEAWCGRHGLAIAIRLGPDRAIVGGLATALEAAADDPAAGSGRVTDIGVRIASHTPWMQAAVQEFAAQLESLRLQAPRSTLVCNVTGSAARAPADLARCLGAQIASPVLWDSCLESVAERNVRCVLEIGPGATLSTMWRAAHPRIPARSIDEFRSAQAVVDWVWREAQPGT